jgi:FixH
VQRRTMLAVATLIVLSVPHAGWAQGAASGHGHAHTGQEQKIGSYEVELAVRGREATLTLLDDKEQPVESAQFTATAVALARGNERRTLAFRPAGANRLTAPVDFPFDGKFRATVTLRGPGGDVGTARYNIDPVR